MKVNDMIHGFRVENIRPLKQAGGTAIEMKHEKSGARLLFLDREDSNKTFSIGFRTVPEDDTGVFHILEHSVLCGSDKYRLKEPFVELLKSSMNTFLNALTFADKTLYPISSQNDKDFFNLMSVYLDAVFSPLIYSKPEIFRQEGWHFEFDEENNATYKGVVFNEMKGVYADADSVLDNKITSLLFPDNGYGFESGGLPSAIPSLTYEQFVHTHSKFYHPSNSYIFLDGSVDIDHTLEYIDGEYLSRYAAIDPMPMPKIQKPVKTERVYGFFEQGADIPKEGHSILGKAYVIGSFDDKETTFACKVLADVLSESNRSVIKSAFLSRGLCEDVSVQVIDGILQPWVLVTFRNIDESKADEIDSLFDQTINDIIKTGIDTAQLEASISNFEFSLKEKDFGVPLGLYYSMASLETWLYDGDPVKGIEFGSVFDSLREKIGSGRYEKLLSDIFINNTHSCSVLLEPSYTLGDEDRQKESDNIKSRLSAMTPAEIETLKQEQSSLAEWQSSVDSPEAIASIPKIDLADIDKEPELVATETDGNIITHTIHTDGITYINMYFDISYLNKSQLFCASLLSVLLGKLDTENHTALQLKTETLTKCGSLSFDVRAYSNPDESENTSVKFCISVSMLDRNTDAALSLVSEILTKTLFSDTDAILELVKQDKTDMYQNIVSSGSKFAMRRAQSSLSAEGAVTEITDGFEYYKWLRELEVTPEFATELKKLCILMFTSSNLLTSITNERPDEIKSKIIDFSSLLPNHTADGKLTITPFERANEAIVIPGDIAFAAMCGASSAIKSGAMTLISHIVTLEYLWNEVRVKGGAYGTGMKSQSDGILSYYSFRDPAAVKSLDTFKTAADFIESYLRSEPDLTGAIIGTVSDISPLLTPRLKALLADGYYIKNITADDRKKIRCDIIGATADDIRNALDAIKKSASESAICVVGSSEQISDCKLIDKKYSL